MWGGWRAHPRCRVAYGRGRRARLQSWVRVRTKHVDTGTEVGAAPQAAAPTPRNGRRVPVTDAGQMNAQRCAAERGH